MSRQYGLSGLGWRWRRNPLRRRSDVVEAWVGVVAVLLLCAVPLLGWWAGSAVDHRLQRLARAEHAQRHLVPATVLDPPRTPPAVADKVGTADPRRSDVLRWTSPDHLSTRTARVSGDIEIRQSGKVSLWTDEHGEPVPPPLDSATATTHAVLAGTAACSMAAGLVLFARQLLMWRLMRRRLAGWEREWARVGQDWGRADADG
jgi:hypothetical protein